MFGWICNFPGTSLADIMFFVDFISFLFGEEENRDSTIYPPNGWGGVENGSI